MTRFFSLCVVYTLFIFSAIAQPVFDLQLYASGFNEPVDIANAGDSRLFIVERVGRIKVIDESGTTLDVDFLDISDKIESGYSEQGLLGLAFAPDYVSSGEFYVYYIDNDENTVIARYKVSTFDTNVADETTEEIVFTAEQPYANHNAGDLNFGPDGYLYFGLGDGGSAGDPGNRAQDPLEKLGKMHRIDVDSVDTYSVPSDNPYFGSTDTLETIWDIGVRNPWRFSFDRSTGDMWIADVGQNLYEEVNFEPAGSSGGLNYGWRCYEADEEFNTVGCDDLDYYNFPIFNYYHSYSTGGYAIVGGFVYRGSMYPGMYGYYVFGDNVSDNWWTLYPDGMGGWSSNFTGNVSSNVSTFGEDVNGEIYCAELYTGKIFHVTDACGDFALSATTIDYECNVISGSIDISVTGGTEPFDIIWNTGDETLDISDLEPGVYSIIVTDDIGCLRTLSVTINDIPTFIATISVDGNILTASDGATWQWYLNGEIIDGATNQVFEITEDGNYSVLVTDLNGCSATSEEVNAVYQGISLLGSIQKIEIYPVPATDNLILGINTFENIEKAFVQICDASGKVMQREFLQNILGDFETTINLENLSSGIYKITLQNDEILWNSNFIINK